MNGLPYYKAYPRDFIEGTIGMSFELKGCYRLLLDLIYMQGGNLPDDARYISGLLGCSVRLWKTMRDELVSLDKIQVSCKFLTNYRAVSELQTSAKLQDKNRESATKYNKNKDITQANAPLTRVYSEPIEERDKSLSSEREEKTDRVKAADDLSRMGIKPKGETHNERARLFLESCPDVSDQSFIAACQRFRSGKVDGHNPRFAPTPGEFAARARLIESLKPNALAQSQAPPAIPFRPANEKTVFLRAFEAQQAKEA